MYTPAGMSEKGLRSDERKGGNKKTYTGIVVEMLHPQYLLLEDLTQVLEMIWNILYPASQVLKGRRCTLLSNTWFCITDDERRHDEGMYPY